VKIHKAVFEEAYKGLAKGGIPIGAVLAKSDKII
jgi:hypothetical protein